MKYYLFILLLASFAVQAEIYRSVDSQGNVVFSDVEDDKSERVTVDIAPSYTAPDIIPLPTTEENNPAEDVDLAVPKYKVSITSPKLNESFSNPETIAVTVEVSPKLSAARNDHVIFKLDGQPVGDKQLTLNTVLTGVNRGSHILVVSVVDKSGKVLKSSKSVLFHVQRHSIAN